MLPVPRCPPDRQANGAMTPRQKATSRSAEHHQAIPVAAKKVTRPSKYARLHELLGLFGNDLITRDEFWRMMAEQRLTDSDIDHFCNGELSPDNPEGLRR
jgi:hypothetical protein